MRSIGGVRQNSTQPFQPGDLAADREKLRLRDAQPVSLVVSDVRLPGRDGLAVLRELRQLDRNLPVLLMTGHGEVANSILS